MLMFKDIYYVCIVIIWNSMLLLLEKFGKVLIVNIEGIYIYIILEYGKYKYWYILIFF